MKATKRTTRRKYLVRASLLASAGVMSTLTGITANAGHGFCELDRHTAVLEHLQHQANHQNSPQCRAGPQEVREGEPRDQGDRPSKSRMPTSLAKFIAAAAAGDPPAVLRSDIAWVPSLAAEGVLLDMSRRNGPQPILKGALPGPLSTNLLRRQLLRDPRRHQHPGAVLEQELISPPPTCPGRPRPSLRCGRTQRADEHVQGPVRPGRRRHRHLERRPVHLEQRGCVHQLAADQRTGYMNGTATEATIQELVNLDKAGDIGSDFVGGSGAVRTRPVSPRASTPCTSTARGP